MRINNVSAKTSVQLIVWLSIIAILMTIGFIVFYCCLSVETLSVTGFFKWLVEAFKTMQADMTEDPFVPWLFVILPVVIYAGWIVAIVSRNKALKEFNSTLNLKTVEFLPDRINFIFNRPQYNIVCAYEEIKSLKLVLHTILVHNKYGSYPAVDEIQLKFLLVNKELTLKNTPMNITNTVYSIIDFGRRMESFSYEFEGVGEVEALKEKIDDYLNKGFKQILTTPTENSFKFMSVIFFVIGAVFFWLFKDTIGSDTWIIAGVAYIPLIVISFIFDIFLLADKIKERKYNI